MFIKDMVGKHLSDTMSIKNDLKQGDALPPLLFNFEVEYAISKVQADQERMKLNGAHQLLVYDRVALLVIRKENGLEVNAEIS
jgi:hypothetical protein